MSIEKRETARGGAYDVRYRGVDGRQRKRTFRTKKEAVNFEADQRSRRARGDWIDPQAGRITVGDYAEQWLKLRPDLRPRTAELYRWILDRRILPRLGSMQMGQVRVAVVRAWHAEMLCKGLGPVTVAKCYRLLRTIMGSAADDGLIGKNPCILRGAGVERSPERPVATPAQVAALAEAAGGRYEMLVLLAAYCGLRLGELLGLRRDGIDLHAGTVTITETLQELTDGRTFFGPPKTEAGRRTVAIPPHLLSPLDAHLRRWVGAEREALVFTGEKGGPLRRTHWNARWRAARDIVGCPHLRFHDLRHTGNTLAASTGASTRELMARLGHASPQAALRYQHATRERDRLIAEALSGLAGYSPSDLAEMASEKCAMDVPWPTAEEVDAEGRTHSDQHLLQSGRRESNSRSQLGKLMFCL